MKQIVLAGWVLIACTSPRGTPEPEQFSVTLRSDALMLTGGPDDHVALTVTAVGSAGTVPAGDVRITATRGKLEGGGGASVLDRTARLSAQGVALLLFRCVDEYGTPVFGSVVLEATLLANGGSVPRDVTAVPLTLTCVVPPNAGGVWFTAPALGSMVDDPNRVAVTLTVADVTGLVPHAATVVVSSNSPVLVTADATSTTPLTLPLELRGPPWMFFVLHPGDLVTPVSLAFAATYVDSASVTHRTTLFFQYGPGPSFASIALTGARVEAGAPQVVNGSPPSVYMHAGATDDAVRLEAVVVDRDGDFGLSCRLGGARRQLVVAAAK